MDLLRTSPRIYVTIAMLVVATAGVILPFSGILAGLVSLAVTVLGLASGLLICSGTVGLLVNVLLTVNSEATPRLRNSLILDFCLQEPFPA